MVFYITNDTTQNAISLIKLVENRPTINEQLITIEKKTKFDLKTYFIINHQLAYGFHKINHLFDNKETDNLFYVLNINSFTCEKSYIDEISLLFESSKKFFPKIKYIFAPSTYLLQDFLSTQKGIDCDIKTTTLISYFKTTLSRITDTKKALQKTHTPFLYMPDLIHDFSKIKFIQLKKFLEYNLNFNQSYVPYKYNLNDITNLNKLITDLKSTEFYQYLK